MHIRTHTRVFSLIILPPHIYMVFRYISLLLLLRSFRLIYTSLQSVHFFLFIFYPALKFLLLIRLTLLLPITQPDQIFFVGWFSFFFSLQLAGGGVTVQEYCSSSTLSIIIVQFKDIGIPINSFARSSVLLSSVCLLLYLPTYSRFFPFFFF